MRYVFSLCISLLALTFVACSDGSDDNQADTSTYVAGQACPEHITYNGICDGNKVVYCNNKGVVEVKDCETKCMVKESYTPPFAECYYECGDIDFSGKCSGDGVDFCSETEGLIHFTCDSGQTCDLKGDIYACI